MKDVRFYEEFKNKRKGISAGNCVALMLQDGRPLYDGGSSMSAIAGVYDHPNSAPATTGVSWDFLRKNCKRVTEARAREVHPELFKWLDKED